MRTEFYIRNSPRNTWEFRRDLEILPRIGDSVVRHTDNASTGPTVHYKVVEVFHVYEDRTWYKNKQEFKDRVSVVLDRVKDRHDEVQRGQ